MSDKYGYIGIETLLDFCANTIDHAITPNDFMRLPRAKTLTADRSKGEYNRGYRDAVQGIADEMVKQGKYIVQDRPQGEWIFKTVFPNDKSEFPMGYLVCSVCGSHHSNSTPCNYCDNCGARMKGADDD